MAINPWTPTIRIFGLSLTGGVGTQLIEYDLTNTHEGPQMSTFVTDEEGGWKNGTFNFKRVFTKDRGLSQAKFVEVYSHATHIASGAIPLYTGWVQSIVEREYDYTIKTVGLIERTKEIFNTTDNDLIYTGTTAKEILVDIYATLDLVSNFSWLDAQIDFDSGGESIDEIVFDRDTSLYDFMKSLAVLSNFWSWGAYRNPPSDVIILFFKEPISLPAGTRTLGADEGLDLTYGDDTDSYRRSWTRKNVVNRAKIMGAQKENSDGRYIKTIDYRTIDALAGVISRNTFGLQQKTFDVPIIRKYDQAISFATVVFNKFASLKFAFNVSVPRIDKFSTAFSVLLPRYHVMQLRDLQGSLLVEDWVSKVTYKVGKSLRANVEVGFRSPDSRDVQLAIANQALKNVTRTAAEPEEGKVYPDSINDDEVVDVPTGGELTDMEGWEGEEEADLEADQDVNRDETSRWVVKSRGGGIDDLYSLGPYPPGSSSSRWRYQDNIYVGIYKFGIGDIVTLVSSYRNDRLTASYILLPDTVTRPCIVTGVQGPPGFETYSLRYASSNFTDLLLDQVTDMGGIELEVNDKIDVIWEFNNGSFLARRPSFNSRYAYPRGS